MHEYYGQTTVLPDSFAGGGQRSFGGAGALALDPVVVSRAQLDAMTAEASRWKLVAAGLGGALLISLVLGKIVRL